MKIKIIDNPKSLINSLTNLGQGSYTVSYRDTLESVAGQWVEVDDKHLFCTSFNAIINGEVYDVHARFVSDVQDDARKGYPWFPIGPKGITCYSPQTLPQLVRDRVLTELVVEFYSFADKKDHSTRIVVQNNFTLGEIQLGVNNYDRRNNKYPIGTVSPVIDKIIINR